MYKQNYQQQTHPSVNSYPFSCDYSKQWWNHCRTFTNNIDMIRITQSTCCYQVVCWLCYLRFWLEKLSQGMISLRFYCYLLPRDNPNIFMITRDVQELCEIKTYSLNRELGQITVSRKSASIFNISENKARLRTKLIFTKYQ